MPFRLARLALALLPIVIIAAEPASRQAPAYTAASIVNLASGLPGPIAPGTLVAIYGTDLALVARARQDNDLVGDQLPTVLPSTGVTVKVNGVLATIEYVSPTVVTFLVPVYLTPGPATITLARNALTGPAVKVQLQSLAPELFLYSDGVVLGRHLESGEWITEENPAVPGEAIVLYATGLGTTSPPQVYRRMPREPADLARLDQLSVSLGALTLPAEDLMYAGIMPGYPGVYEIRLRVPPDAEANPAVVLDLSGLRNSQEATLWLNRPPTQPPVAIMRNTK